MSNPAPLRIRTLRLVGARRNYEVPFTKNGQPRDLAVIAGQIATGKTTVLEFINWCLGAKSHPEHDEIMANVRTAQLAIDVLDSDATDQQYLSYVIDRPLGPASTKAWLYAGPFEQMSAVPLRSLSPDSADPESLSQWLLRACGMSGMHLKQAPTKSDSRTSILSFLDLRPLWYLTNRRMGSGNLALESKPPMSIKLNQVVDLMFEVSNDEASARSRRIEELSTEERELRRTLDTLRRFLDDADFRDLEETAQIKDRLTIELADVVARRRNADAHLKSESTFAEDLRREYEEAVGAVGDLTSKLRDRSTLLRRLNPLRAQYADELRRLELLDESVALFDSLAITICPACQTKLSRRVELIGGECTLCHESPVSGEMDDSVPSKVDLASERRSLGRRLTQLKEFSNEVGREIVRLEAEEIHAKEVVRERQSAIDVATREAVSPFLAARDELAAKQADLAGKLQVLRQSERVMEQLAQMEREHRQVTSRLAVEKELQRKQAETSAPRGDVLAQLSSRMEKILRDFGFPKIDEVEIDKKLVPFVRGKRYDKVGSSGAMTLIALAWTLSIYELAVERGGGHPGFLLIDSPQQNLMPDQTVEEDDDQLARELRASGASIATNIYAHITGWLGSHQTAQVIMVDNAPPAMAKNAIAVRYSGDPLDPPYGLIDNADGREVSD